MMSIMSIGERLMNYDDGIFLFNISLSQVMEGNSNTYLAAKQELSPVILASKVIIVGDYFDDHRFV